jgi:tRNA threonylcarbamoyladenosine biosynthesis protein TsaB
VINILTLETSETIGTLAAARGDQLLLEIKLDAQVRAAQSFALGIRRLLAEVGWKPSEVELVATTIGPGSFTGLRVGVTAAKALAYAAGAEVLGIDTLETIAAAAPREIGEISVAVDAQRGQVAAGTFRRGETGWFEAVAPWTVLDVEAWLAGLAPGSCLSGPVLQKILRRVPGHLKPIDPQFWCPSAAWVARLAARYFAAGRRDDLWKLAPRYCRSSAAEETWRAREREI